MNLLEPAGHQVAYVLFPEFRGQIPHSESLGGFIGRVVHTAPGGLSRFFQDELTAFRDFVRKTEQSFVLKAIASRQDRLQSAEGFVRRIVEDFKFQCSEERIAERIDAMQRIFPLPLYVVDGLVTSIIERGLDMTKKDRANSLWDIHIAFSIGTDASFEGAPLWLVTDDGAIVNAPKAAATLGVKHLDEYCAILKSGWCGFRSLIAP